MHVVRTLANFKKFTKGNTRKLLVFSVTPFKIDQNKNRSSSRY